MTFEVLAAFALQSTAVALLALGAERLLPRHDAPSRAALWLLALLSGVFGPIGLMLFSKGGVASPVASAVFNVAAIGRTAPAEARLGAVWVVALGGVLLAAWRLCGLARLRRYVSAADPLAPDAAIAAEIASLESRVGVQAAYRVSNTLESPLVSGFRNPVVVLPAGFSAMPPQQRMAILAHELMHARRRDWLKLLAEEALRCAVWFTPAIHIILRKLRLVREMAVDAAALQVTRDRHAYLEALVEIARRPIRAEALAAPLFLEPHSLEQRVAALLEDHPMPKTRRIAALAVILFLLPAAARWAHDAFPWRLAAAPQAVHRVGDGVKAPKLLTKVEPELTDEAREAKVDDTVILAVEIHPDGRPHNIRVTKSLGMGLDEQAVAAVEQWTFEPGTKDGKPVTVAATIEVNFRAE